MRLSQWHNYRLKATSRPAHRRKWKSQRISSNISSRVWRWRGTTYHVFVLLSKCRLVMFSLSPAAGRYTTPKRKRNKKKPSLCHIQNLILPCAEESLLLNTSLRQFVLFSIRNDGQNQFVWITCMYIRMWRKEEKKNWDFLFFLYGAIWRKRIVTVV